MRTVGVTLTKAGSIASFACVIHCALTPIAVLVLPFFATLSWGGSDLFLSAMLAETTEWVFLTMMVVLTGASLLLTYPLHRNVRPMLISAFGLGLVILARNVTDHGGMNEIALELTGAGFITWAAVWNSRICRCLSCHT